MMQKIWMILENQSLFVYVIAGVCLWGSFSKLLLQGRLARLLRASEHMASATQKQLRTMRNQYENSLNMDLQVHNIHAFVDKHLLKLRCCGIPIRIWDGMTLEAALVSVAAGGLGVIHSIHKGYGEGTIYSILLATVISCACLLTLENIFRIEDSIDRLQANIEDYLENNLQNRLGRPLVSRSARGQRQAAAAEERTGQLQTGTEGRAQARPLETTDSDHTEWTRSQGVTEPEEIPEYEIRRRAGGSAAQRAAAGVSTPGRHDAGSGAIGQQEAAAGQEAEVVAQVLRNFFSS